MKDKLEKIGTNAEIHTEWGFTIIVKILDYKNSYGKDRWLVEPMSGDGQGWVQNLDFSSFQ